MELTRVQIVWSDNFLRLAAAADLEFDNPDSHFFYRGVHPATGMIQLRDAETGDEILVHKDDIRLINLGLMKDGA